MKYVLALSIGLNFFFIFFSRTPKSEASENNAIVEEISSTPESDKSQKPPFATLRPVSSKPATEKAPAQGRGLSSIELKPILSKVSTTKMPGELYALVAALNPPAALKIYFNAVEKDCHGLEEPVSTAESFYDPLQNNECVWAIQRYADALEDYETKEKPISEINDRELLGAKLRTSFQLLFEPAETDRFLKMSRRYLELEPDNPNVIRGMLQTMSASLSNDPKSPDYWKEMEWAYRKLQSLVPKDASLEEYDLQVRTGPSDELLGREATKHIAENPRSGLGYFYLAKYEYERSNSPAATKYLQRAVELEPREVRFSRALESLVKDGSTFFNIGFQDNNFSLDRIGK